MSVFDHLAKDEQRSHNRLLAHFATADYERLRPHLKPILLHEQAVLYVPHRPIESIYFLDSGVASMVVTMTNGRNVEVGTVGNEGFVGLPVLFGAETPEIGTYMRVAGTGLRMPAALLRHEFDRSQSLRALLLRYAGAFFNQVTQSAACAYHHPLESRCCRWLSMTRDRVPSDRFVLTQEFLAMMLGVRRSSVSAVMGELQRKGFVRYSRGRVNIVNRKALQTAACECYHVTKAQFDRLLGENA